MCRNKFFDAVFVKIGLKIMPKITLFWIVAVAKNYFVFKVFLIIKNFIFYIRTKCIKLIVAFSFCFVKTPTTRLFIIRFVIVRARARLSALERGCPR